MVVRWFERAIVGKMRMMSAKRELFEKVKMNKCLSGTVDGSYIEGEVEKTVFLKH